MPGGSIGKDVGDAVLYVEKAGHGLLCGGFLYQGQPGAVLGDAESVYVSDGVNLTAGIMVYGKGCSHVLFLAVRFLDETGVRGCEGHRLKAVTACLVGLHRGKLQDLCGLEVYYCQGILGQIVAFFLFDLCLPGFLEFRLYEAHGIAVIVQDGGLVAAGDNYFPTSFAHYTEIQVTVSFLRLNCVRYHVAGRGYYGLGHAFPCVKDAVVKGLFLRRCGEAYQERSKNQCSFQISASIRFSTI